jgi:tRNA (cytidine/uridine-2'-O-)-methyltransferase
MASTKAKHTHTEVKYNKDDFIMFGSEGSGIPEEILLNYKDTCIRIPMLAKYRSLNLSNSVAIVLYEALRQTGFDSFLLEGELHNHRWSEVE